MKKHALLFSLFICFNISAQDILGEWFLHHITVEGTTQYSTIPNSFNQIYFEENQFNGIVCSNGHSGDYILNNDNTITITGFVALAGTCSYEIENGVFLHPYMWDILGSEQNAIFPYTINDIGSNQTLSLTSPNGNSAFYRRVPLESSLPEVWYLHEISVDNVITENTFNSQSSIEFTANSVFGGIEYLGTGVCNGFFGAYNLASPVTLVMEYFGSTLATCSGNEERDFENDYFDIFRNTDPLTITYDITGTGNDEVLVLTNPDGDYALYGRQERLSTSEFEVELNNLRLTNNPVQETLTFNSIGDIEANYAIYSINGKQLTKTKSLDSKIIDVSGLDAGLYFLRIISNSNYKTIKFIRN